MADVSAPVRAGRPKSEAKAEAILHAASELFLSQGFQGTSMDAVAKRAGVSKQTVYSHFANKEELFKACIGAKVAGYGFDSAAMVEDSHASTTCLCARLVMSFEMSPLTMRCNPGYVFASEIAKRPSPPPTSNRLSAQLPISMRFDRSRYPGSMKRVSEL